MYSCVYVLFLTTKKTLSTASICSKKKLWNEKKLLASNEYSD